MAEDEKPPEEETPENEDTEEEDSGGSEDGDEEEETDDGEEEDTEEDEEEEDEKPPEDVEPETRGETEKPKEEEEDEEEVDPEDEKAIARVVDKKLSPLAKKIQKQNDEIEVNSYIVDHPEMAKYKKTILKHVAHPAYKNIPIKNIASMVSANDQQKIGAKKERVAQEKANATKDGSNSSRKKPGGKVDYTTMSKEDMETEIAKAKGQRV